MTNEEKELRLQKLLQDQKKIHLIEANNAKEIRQLLKELTGKI